MSCGRSSKTSATRCSQTMGRSNGWSHSAAASRQTTGRGRHPRTCVAGVTFVALANAFKQSGSAKPGASAPAISIEPPSPAPLTRYLSPAFWGPDTWHTTGSGYVERGQRRLHGLRASPSIRPTSHPRASSRSPRKTIPSPARRWHGTHGRGHSLGVRPCEGSLSGRRARAARLSKATLRVRQGEEPPGPYSVLELDTPYVFILRVYVNSPAPSSGLISLCSGGTGYPADSTGVPRPPERTV